MLKILLNKKKMTIKNKWTTSLLLIKVLISSHEKMVMINKKVFKIISQIRIINLTLIMIMKINIIIITRESIRSYRILIKLRNRKMFKEKMFFLLRIKIIVFCYHQIYLIVQLVTV